MAHLALSHILAFKGLLGGHKPTAQDGVLGVILLGGFLLFRKRR